MDSSGNKQAKDTHLVEQHDYVFFVTNDRLMLAPREFASGFEEGTLQFFDTVLPGCVRFIERRGVIGAAPSASVTLRRAEAVLLEVDIDEHALLKVDFPEAGHTSVRLPGTANLGAHHAIA